jgi:uncharacterized protein YbjT (DUF2867 family)
VILVTGATGKVGGESARLLAAEQVPVRALVRSADRAADLAARGVDLAVGDLNDLTSIETAFDGVTTLIMVTPGNPAQEKAVIDAAVRAGIGHIVYLTSKASLDAPIERRRWHAQVELALTESGLPHTLLRSNAYMQNMLALGPVISATSRFASSAAGGRMGMADTRDVAAVAATIGKEPERHVGATYHLTGPESISYPEIARILTDLLGRAITFEAISQKEERARMIDRGIPEPVATMNAQAFHLNATGDADWVTDDVATLIHRAPRSFGTFAADHLQAFRA